MDGFLAAEVPVDARLDCDVDGRVDAEVPVDARPVCDVDVLAVPFPAVL